ncbi:MAG: phosphohydrolase, partial [Thermus sp.]|nr:phosphohydrolase [Thermus sp.]
MRLEVRLPLNASVSHLFIFALALTALTPAWLAPLWVFLFQSSGNIWYKRLFNRSQDALATALAGMVWLFFQQNTLYLGNLNLSTGTGIALAALAFFITNAILVTSIIHLSTQTPLREIWRRNFGWVALSYLVLSPLALLLARAYETPLIGNWGGWTVLFFLIPLYYSR